MSKETLQQFARQLQVWSSDEFQNKPGPFRSVEASPSFLGETETPASVVYWINRESHLAGGLLLLPRKDPEAVLESGREICTALGLECYYTWGIAEVAAWQINGTPNRLWSEPLPEAAMQEADAFKDALSLLLQNMQNRFFSQQQQLPHLSASYLANLLHNCIESTLPVAAAACNQGKGQQSSSLEIGRRALATAVLQIVALCSQNRLPERSNPADLLSDLKLATKRLPSPLASALVPSNSDPQLPMAATIKLHHLFQRMQQLGTALTPFIAEAVQLLLHFWSGTISLSPLPASLKKNRSTLILNPDRYHPDMTVAIEIAPPPMTAATALLRFLQSSNRRHPVQYNDLLELQTPVVCDEVNGTLSDRSRIPSSDHKRLNALLRNSWPNRNIRLAPSTPQWACRLIHLAGLLHGRPHGILTLPADWLWSAYGEQVYTLLTERCTLNRITPDGRDRVRIEYNHPSGKQQVYVDSFAGDVRLLDNQEKAPTRPDILLALSLSLPTFELMRNAELQTATEQADNLPAIELFLLSSLGRGLWKILAPKKPMPKREKLIAELVRTGLPLPGDETLSALSMLAKKHIDPDTASIDRELEVWLGAECLTGAITRFKLPPASTEIPLDDNQADIKASELIRQGAVPTFPDDYLYSAEGGRLSYSITGQLRPVDEFFNTVTLASPQGGTLLIDGIAKARALELISSFRTGDVELPEDDQQAGTILDRYLKDLRKLYLKIRQEALAAENLIQPAQIEQIWSQLPVPPRSAIDDN